MIIGPDPMRRIFLMSVRFGTFEKLLSSGQLLAKICLNPEPVKLTTNPQSQPKSRKISIAGPVDYLSVQ